MRSLYSAALRGPRGYARIQMLVAIEQIHRKGLVLDEPVAIDLVASALNQEGRESAFRAKSGFELHAELNRVSGGVLLRAQFQTQVVGPCKRCLKDVPLALPVEFTLSLIPEAMAKGDAGVGAGDDDQQADRVGSFALEDADEEIFDGRTIDLDPILKEQILLALPMSVVCSEECKGLCPSCGKDLNQGACGCGPQLGDPRLAVLKNIKLN